MKLVWNRSTAGLVSGLLLFIPGSLSAQIEWPNLQFEPVTLGLTRPADIQQPDDGRDRLFVVEQPGRITIVEDGEQRTFLDITDRVETSGNEQGLLGLAFPENYAEKGRFYVNYTTDSSEDPGATTVSRFKVTGDPDVGDPDSEEVLLQISQPHSNHNGGQLQFGPDGYLYVSVGDGGSSRDPGENAQDPTVLLGKILRIDVEGAVAGEPSEEAPEQSPGEAPYLIPSDNPFVDDPGTRDEIWSLGLRNPWRFSFDAETGDMYIADVGQNDWEEINFEPAESPGGRNYGWDFYEGTERQPDYNPNPLPGDVDFVFPFFEYGRDQGISVTGGYLYRGETFPRMQGIYFFGDFGSGRIWGAQRDPEGEWQVSELTSTSFQITSFGEDQAGELYLANRRGGAILRLVDTRDRQYLKLVEGEWDPESGFTFTIGVDSEKAYEIGASLNLEEWTDLGSFEPGSRRLNVTDEGAGDLKGVYYRVRELEE